MSSATRAGRGTPRSTVAPAASKTAADASTTAGDLARRPRSAPPRSVRQRDAQPGRAPAVERRARTASPGSPSAVGTRGSGPASTESSSARSLDVAGQRAARPRCVSQLVVGRPGRHPARATGAGRRRRRTTPGCAASRPCRSRRRAAPSRPRSAHAAPPLDPPADRVGSTGLRVVPKTVLKVCEPAANSGTLVLPIVTAPAARIRSTTRSSRVGHVVGEQRRAVRRTPAGHLVGVLERERQPVQRPELRRPRAVAASAAAAPARARSSSRETIALSCGLRSAIRARCRSSSSRAEISRSRTAAAISRAVESTVRSLIGPHLDRA